MFTLFIILCVITIVIAIAIAKPKDKHPKVDDGIKDAVSQVMDSSPAEPIPNKGVVKSEMESFVRKPKGRVDKHSDIIFTVKGTYYRDGQSKAAASLCEKGDRLILKREPDNPADKNAVQVYTMTGQMIGYVERDHSGTIAELIDYINTCNVYKVSHHDLPYIDAIVEFSETPMQQPDFITDDKEMTTRQKMALDFFNFQQAGYHEVYARIVNNKELPLKSRQTLAELKLFTQVILEKDDSNPSRPYAVKVLSEDGVLLGWLDADRAYVVYNHFDEVKCVKTATLGKDSLTFLMPTSVNLLDVPADLKSYPYDMTLFPETSEAYKMRSSQPERALEILLPIVKKEHDYRAANYCCTCYRTLKQPDKELEMIDFILAKIEAYREDYEQLEGKTHIDGEVAKWRRRREIVQKMIKRN